MRFIYSTLEYYIMPLVSIGMEIKEKDLELYNQLLTLAPIDSEWDAYVIFSSL